MVVDNGLLLLAGVRISGGRSWFDEHVAKRAMHHVVGLYHMLHCRTGVSDVSHYEDAILPQVSYRMSA